MLVGAQIIEEDVVVRSGEIPRFYKEANCQVPPQITQYRQTYTYGYVKGRQATIDDIPKILAVAEKDIWQVPSMGTVLLEQRAKDHYCNNIRTIASRYCKGITYRAVVEALDIIRKASLPIAEVVHGNMLFEHILFQGDGNPLFINPIDPCQCITPALDRGCLLQSYCMRWEERSADTPPWQKPRSMPGWADVTDWAFLVSHWVRLLPDWTLENILLGLPILESIKP